jgi:PAS domain-containing protein
MILPETVQALLAAGLGLTAAALLFLWWTRVNSARALAARRLLADSRGSTALIFDDHVLVDATPEARKLLQQARDGETDWDRFVSALAPRFPNLRSQCADLADLGRKNIPAADNSDTVVDATYLDGIVRLEMNCEADGVDPAERLIVAAMEQELTLLRSIGDNAPQLIWQCTPAGELAWANRAYLDLVERAFPPAGDDPLPWPPHDLFHDLARPGDAGPVVEQKWVTSAGHLAPRCYEITSVRRDLGTMHYAVDITEVIEAREDQQKFVQTLTKTFAQLSVGLAIFDRERRLKLFNPALVDLLGLPTDFLI